jgi:hypothetical protein
MSDQPISNPHAQEGGAPASAASTPSSAASSGGTKAVKSVVIPTELVEAVAERADREDRTPGKIVERALRAYLASDAGIES